MQPITGSDHQSRPAQRSRGRQLDQSGDAAILQVALEGLVEFGYDQLTMDEIAARALAVKCVLYRRWPSKALLIIDAVVSWRVARSPLRIPDPVSLLGDFDASVEAVPEFDESDEPMLRVSLSFRISGGAPGTRSRHLGIKRSFPMVAPRRSGREIARFRRKPRCRVSVWFRGVREI